VGRSVTDYVPHSELDVRALLDAVGAQSIEALFEDIPEAVRRREPLALPAGLSELEVLNEMRRLAAASTPATSLVSFLGAGIYDHYVPAVVDAVVSRSELATAYTPYQAERSQGVLQTIFEFQTAICELTGMDVSNAGLYDAGTALAEASLLAGHQTRRGRVVVSAGVHPEYRQVLATETAHHGPRPQVVDLAAGAATDLEALGAAVDADTRPSSSSSPTSSGPSRTWVRRPRSRTRPGRSSWSSATRLRWASSRRLAAWAPTSSSARLRRSVAP